MGSGDARTSSYAPLRAQLQKVLAARRIDAPANRILLTDSMQAIDLVGRRLVQPSDKILVDDPGYYNFLANLRVHRAQVIGAPFRRDGPDLEAFASLAGQHRPVLCITNSTLLNPTGATLAPAVAHRLLKIAEAHDIAILEDDICSDFDEHLAPRLAAMDQLNRVICVGSFSKTLPAACRCGWIAARRDSIDGLADLRMATIFSNNELSAQLLHQLLTDGSYCKHADAMRTRLRVASVRVRGHLEACGLSLWAEPRGGMFLWAKLPTGHDSAEIARQALASGIALVPAFRARQRLFYVSTLPNRTTSGSTIFSRACCSDVPASQRCQRLPELKDHSWLPRNSQFRTPVAACKNSALS